MNEIIIGIITATGSSFVNFIATKSYNYYTGNSKNFFWKNKYPNIKNVRISNDFEELKKRTRIVIIDDEDNFPVTLFQSEGYSIEKWDTVKDYNKLEAGFYDIIILDIKGVALHISEEDGLGVLESIKKKNPAQIIVAYSQHSYDLGKARFWELADENIAKPSDYLKIKNIIDNLISIQFQPERYIECLHNMLNKNHISTKDVKKLDNEIVKHIKNKTTPNWVEIFPFAKGNPDLNQPLKTICSTIIKFYK